MVHRKALKLAVACAATIAALTGLTSVVVIAGASGPGTTYYACLKSGELTHVGTAPPTCKKHSTAISWNSQGPSGPPGADGTDGAPGAAGPQGPAGPGPIYVAANTNGTVNGSVDTPVVLATNVNGFDVQLTCAANFALDNAAVQARLTSADPSIQSVNTYESSLIPGDRPSADSQSGSQLHSADQIAIIDNINPGNPESMFTQGYVVANSGGIASQPEAGFWFSLYLQFQLQTGGASGNCSVTGTLVPVSGSRTAPLPIILPPPIS